MILSDISVDRPVFATVISLLLVAFGVINFINLPLRQYPDINSPVVSISTRYSGASAQIIETKITRVIEDRISGVEGIKTIRSSSRDGRSRITIEFSVSRNIDDAANDIRQRVSRLLNNLPEEADPPEVTKDDNDERSIMWMHLKSTNMDRLELADYAHRYLLDRLSSVDGVARIRFGNSTYAMRLWIDRQKLAARGLTVEDIERALRAENIELPAGRIESLEREFTVRIARKYDTEQDFAKLVINQSDDGHLTLLGDVAKVHLEAENTRKTMRSDGELMVGMGVVKQSKGNALDVARAVKAEVAKIAKNLPPGTTLEVNSDNSIFIEEAINEVYKTFAIAMALVVLVIYLFLGSVRAMFIPAITVPVSIVASFIFLSLAGFTVNLLTLLALVLSIGLVVDDAILVLENIYRRVEKGEPPLLAAYYGAREVGFAVIATTLVLVAVFVPIIFIEGQTGRLFTEFSLSMAAAVVFSSLIALTLTPMLCSKMLRKGGASGNFHNASFGFFRKVENGYMRVLNWFFARAWLVGVLLMVVSISAFSLFRLLPAELMPLEDRGSFFVSAKGPEGTSFENMIGHMKSVEDTLLELRKSGEANNIMLVVPGFGSSATVNAGSGMVQLKRWSERKRSAQEIRKELQRALNGHPNLRIFIAMPRGMGGGGGGQPVQFVLQGNDYKKLARWRDIVLARARDYPGLIGASSNYEETKPQILVDIDRVRAADLGVSVATVGRTLETMLGSRKVTTFIDDGEEYPVILEGIKEASRTPNDMTNIYVRSGRTGDLIPLSSLVTLRETASPSRLNRFNRLRAITISANLAPGYELGTALEFLENVVREDLPAEAAFDYNGESRTFQEAGKSVYLVFGLALITVFLVLAAQFESFRHPLIIILTVPFAIVGAFIGLYLTDQTLNIYSQIGLIMLMGLATKNGILIVEFTNQLRDQGVEFMEALREASRKRLRPIIMTSITTVMGAMALILGTGAGSETRFVIGIVIISGVSVATFFTLFVVPVAYMVIGRNSSSPQTVKRQREAIEKQ